MSKINFPFGAESKENERGSWWTVEGTSLKMQHLISFKTVETLALGILRELHKNAMSYIKQILEATSHKKATVWPSTFHAGNCWISKYELISDVLQWTLHTDVQEMDDITRTYLQQLCADTGCSLEDLPGERDE